MLLPTMRAYVCAAFKGFHLRVSMRTNSVPKPSAMHKKPRACSCGVKHVVQRNVRQCNAMSCNVMQSNAI